MFFPKWFKKKNNLELKKPDKFLLPEDKKEIKKLIKEQVKHEKKIEEEKRKIENIDHKIIIIQKSSKTLFKQIAPVHHYLRHHSKLYYNWHLNPHAGKIHLSVLIVYCLSIFAGILSAIALPPVSPIRASGASWWNTDWKYRRLITIDHTKVPDVANPSTTYANFPVLISLTGLSNINANGTDIRFTDSSGNLLPREIESYSSGNLVVWVKFTLTKDAGDSSNDTLYMYYGNPAATEPAPDSPYGSQNVWDSNYVGVWHLNDDLNNSVTNIAATDNGTVGYATGKIGNGREGDRNPTSDNLYTDIIPKGSIHTLEAWAKSDGVPAGVWDGVAGVHDDNNHRIFIGVYDPNTGDKWLYGAGNVYKYPTNVVVSSNTWYHVVITLNGSNAKFYVNGVEQTAEALVYGWSGENSVVFEILNVNRPSEEHAWDGIVDEVRISNVARSASWIATEYNNQSSPLTFTTAGAEESLKLVFATSAKTLNAGVESDAYTIQAQDSSGNPVNVSSNITVNLSSNSAGYKKFAATLGGAAVTSVTISSGQNSTNFYYTDCKVGTPTITASATGFTSATQQQTINAPPPVSETQTWWDTTFAYRKKLTFNHSSIDETMLNFPVLIKLNSSNFDYSKAKANGEDLRFVDSNQTTELNYEIEKWDPAGDSFVWVSVPAINASSSTDHIWIYYGKPTASAGQNPHNVWDSNYKGVWHLKESGNGTAGEYVDSTSNNNSGQGGGGTASQVPTQTDAKIGKGQSFDGSNDQINIGDSNSLDLAGQLTIEAWVNYRGVPKDTGNYDWYCILMKGSYGSSNYGIMQEVKTSPPDTQNLRLYLEGSGVTSYNFGGTLVNSNWYYITAIYDQSTAKVYVNAVGKATANKSDTLTTDNNILYIGRNAGSNYPFNGIIDEVRISNIARSASWIATEYNNQSDPTTYVSTGSEQSLKIVFTTAPKTLTAGIESDAYTIQVQDSNNTVQNVTSDTVVDLTSNSPGTYHFAATPGGPAITQRTISAGQNLVSFYYTDLRDSGTSTLAITSAGFTGVSQDQTVVNLPPSSAITSPTDGAVFGAGTLQIQGTATDAGGGVVGQVQVSIDGGTTWNDATNTGTNFSTWTYNTNITQTGTYNLKTKAKDSLGTWETLGAGINIQIDAEIPSISIDSPIDNEWIRSTSYTIKGRGTDLGASPINKVELSFDQGASWVLATATSANFASYEYIWSNYSEGDKVIQAKATDGVGNVSQIFEVKPKVDYNPPTAPKEVKMYDVSARQIPAYAVYLSWQSSSDNVSGVKNYHILRGSQEIGTVTETSYLDNSATFGTFSYSIIAEDNASNKSSSAQAVDKNGKNSLNILAKSGEGPKISDIKARPSEIVSNKKTSALISWKTDIPSTSTVYWGQTTTYSNNSLKQTNLNMGHSVLIEDLEPGTTYHFKVSSTDQFGATTQSDDQTFQSTPAPKEETIWEKILDILQDIWNKIKGWMSKPSIAQSSQTKTGFLSVSDISLPNTPQYLIWWPQGKGQVNLQRAEEGGSFQTITSTDKNYYLDKEVKAKTNYTYKLNNLTASTLIEGGVPKITNITAEPLSATEDKAEVMITWQTDKLSNSQVLYGAGAENYSEKTEIDSLLNTNHTVIISNLKPATLYHFKVMSNDVYSSDMTFTTKAAPQKKTVLQIILETLKNSFSLLAKLLR